MSSLTVAPYPCQSLLFFASLVDGKQYPILTLLYISFTFSYQLGWASLHVISGYSDFFICEMLKCLCLLSIFIMVAFSYLFIRILYVFWINPLLVICVAYSIFFFFFSLFPPPLFNSSVCPYFSYHYCPSVLSQNVIMTAHAAVWR